MKRDPHFAPGLERAIVGFHLDEEGQWVADLVCGHTQHVRHDPPWQNRPWVVSKKGRAAFIGRRLMCTDCLMGSRTDPARDS